MNLPHWNDLEAYRPPMMSSSEWLLIAVTGALLGALPGCKPREGGRCEEGEQACADERNKLSCADGKYVSSPCRGEKGCSTADDKVSCDLSGNAAGDPCPKEDEGHAGCAPGGTHALRCHDGRLDKEPCLGPKGCEQKDDVAVCDHSVAERDQACGLAARGRSACSLDNSEALICEDGKFVAEYPCRGPKGCRLNEGRPTCDRSVAAEGEGCSRLPADSKSCSADGKSLLVCENGRFVRMRPCAGKEGCQATDKGLVCDKKK